jgi:hypothetical protein
VGRVPEWIRELRRQVVARNGGRLDDVEFTFRGGGVAKTLGEATLRNRVKSHPDVGERWYPDILADIRKEQEAERRRQIAQPTPQEGGNEIVNGGAGKGQAVEAH